ncbi:1-deoxy-D-xylulose-5-phosphate synthase, partial [Neisseria meningitidis]
YRQLVHDITLQSLRVFCVVARAGIVGAGGPARAGLYDLSFLRGVPNMIVAGRRDESECRLLLSACYQADGPAAVRYPRGRGTGAPVSDGMEILKTGKGIIR